MGIIAKEKGGDFKLCPQGAHIAICDMVVDLGIQKGFYGPKHKVFLRFEVPGERVEYQKDGKTISGPMTVGLTASPSLSKKATLRALLESWRGREFTKEELEGFDLFNILGAACQVVIIHNKAENGNTYANIKSIIPLPKGTPKPAPENPLLKYSPDTPGDLGKLPDWLQKKIGEAVSETPEDEPVSGGGGGTDDFDRDEIPFITRHSVW